MEKKLLEFTHEKDSLKGNQKEFKIEKVIKRKGDKLYVKWKEWKGYYDFLTIGLIKKVFLYKMSYFQELHTHSKNKIQV